MLFARKEETVSILQSKYNGGTGATSIDDSARWLSRVTLAVAIIMIGWGLSVIFTQPVTTLCSSNLSCAPQLSQHRQIRQKYCSMSWL